MNIDEITVNNFDLIDSILTFDNPHDFYFLQIMQRRKDDNVVGVSSNYRVIKSYYIYSHEELMRRKDKIIELCHRNNARAYIWLNVRNTVDVSWTCLEKFAELIKNNNTDMCYRVFDRACGSTRKKGSKQMFLIDLDSKEQEYINTVISIINECNGEHENHILYEIPTVHGVHLITEGFNLYKFYQLLVMYKLEHIDVHKDNPTLLYY